MAVALSLFFVAIGAGLAWMAITAASGTGQSSSTIQYVLAAGTLLGGAITVVCARQFVLAWKQPILVLDKVGIRAPQQGKFVLWPEIASARIDSSGEAILLRLEPRQPDRNKKLAWLTGYSTNINLDFSAKRSDDILSAVRSHPCYRGDDASTD